MKKRKKQMLVYTDLHDIHAIEKTAVAMGNFDGLHLGHVELIRRTVAGARNAGVKSAVFTFSEHPKNSLAGGRIIRNIQYPEEKAGEIADLGVDYLFSIPFSEEMHHMPPKNFIEDLLLDCFNMAEAHCGFNFRFGYRAAGDAEILREAGAEHGFPVHVLDALQINGVVVSSSLIREMISEGRMEECAAFLGRNYCAGGEVTEGNRIGRTLGFPTLNILMDESMAVPAYGVYVTDCHVDGRVYPGVTNVGVRPTVGDGKKSIETHLLDFEGDLYGKTIRVEFIKKLRDEMRFAGVEQLALQITKDTADAKTYHQAAKASPDAYCTDN
jgi:riboflavin kinase/FMN adenylyltransferase